MIWIGYTTLYRDGGPKFERAAATLARELRERQATRSPTRSPSSTSTSSVVCECVESKRDFVDAMERIRAAGEQIEELHFIGHAGMYGPMFRTTKMPEQFSPHEWAELAAPRVVDGKQARGPGLSGSSGAPTLPFASGASAYFHACRTARWFAPFFARTFGVRTFGYHWYTSVSTRPDVFRWEGPLARMRPDAPLYIVACPGKKSHGLAGSIAKYAGLVRAEKMIQFDPAPVDGDPSYDGVAELYAEVFADITVREEEWRWIDAHVLPGARVLDVGCGNGALLRQLAPRIASGHGVDASAKMIALAQARSSDGKLGQDKLDFTRIEGPRLPLADRSVDIILSMLSFRYLDWDPMMNEMRRVLAPGGRILILDMVTVPSKPSELPRVVRDKLRSLVGQRRHPEFARALKRLVADPRWKTMLKYNPIRSDHEFRWYLESRFPGRTAEILTLGHDTRVLAFDSGPLEPGWVAPQSYP